MRNTLRAQSPVTALAAFAIIATAGLLSTCSSGGSGSPVAQQSPQAAAASPAAPLTPVSQPSPASPVGPVSPASPASPAPAAPSPHRAGHLDPATFSMVTVSFTESDGTDLRFHKRFRSPAVIARLTRIVNSLPAAKPASTSCPAADFTYRVSFTGTGSQPDTMVTTRSCPADRIAVGGEAQGPLWDPEGTVAAEVKRLMHIRISRSTAGTGTVPPM